MASVLQTARNAVRGLSGRLGASFQQQRGAHELHAKKNKYVEEWLTRREDIEQEFVLTTGTTLKVLLLAVGVPVLSYNMIVQEMQADDEAAGRPVRSFLWSHAPSKPASSS